MQDADIADWLPVDQHSNEKRSELWYRTLGDKKRTGGREGKKIEGTFQKVLELPAFEPQLLMGPATPRSANLPSGWPKAIDKNFPEKTQQLAKALTEGIQPTCQSTFQLHLFRWLQKCTAPIRKSIQ
jgi:hypothetical protein